MKTTWKELKYALYLARHPFKGFWEIKHEGEGSLKTALILLGAAILVQILSERYTGYLFGGGASPYYNMLDTIVSFLVIVLSWCVSNWCLTCLSDGKGTFRDILIATAYALAPFILLQAVMIVLSNVFILREEVFYNLFNGLSLFWSGFLLVIGMLVTHQFTLNRTLVVCVFTIVGMLAMGCLALLVFNLAQQVLGFVTILMDEIIMRLSY